MMEKLEELTTELPNEETQQLDRLSVREILRLMNEEDKKVPFAVERVLDQVADAVELIAASLENGGRLFYFGAGTSGRLGILDASECPPTFGTDPELVQGVIAGGPAAMVRAIEGAEDSPELGRQDVHTYGVKAGDVVVGIAASGRTPYVIGALREARRLNAATIALSCNEHAVIDAFADVAINVVVGPEVLTGSTRLKAGTAQKLVLNMLTTATMIKLGKVYGNLMVSVQATNVKLRERVKRIVMEVTGASYAEAERLAELANGDAKTAIVMKLTGRGAEEARRLLDEAGGRIRDVLDGLG
ncbi:MULTISPECIES: N-acetylmuramic acid 6-phosphate etherase [Brevibacillus]|jgi:N-acetylmuramic acid 6-phosphate etherase|uniref:N-acetylmuramic acid 6-phosphate etherase n=1 Tax=Brevibacillus thermoruber TaxID=33942 RepID=A0A9X3TPD1_9BACL|nr:MULTISPECIES: N-acetylmuramic acid 6-phosphate etherase [Brevibacillus]MDA5108321.1 N-acetylmuramic acid 6-phosphate etherase [Brevibacillus thermoruber]TRY27414.1 N-acetylmuramic acid 6-phosphate etherase [Brevibacillus sp. LEMMJ03]